MLKGLGSFASLLKQAQELGGRLEGISGELRNRRAEGAAGGGMVTVEVNGMQEVLSCRIDPQLFEQHDQELIEDLIVAATNQALTNARQLHAEAMKSLAGGLGLPGLDEALATLSGRGDAQGPG